MRRIRQGGAILVLAALLVGVPAVLVAITSAVASPALWQNPMAVITQPVSSQLIVVLLAIIAGLVWLHTIMVTGVELWHGLRHRGDPAGQPRSAWRVPGAGLSQPAIRRLVAAALLTGAVAPTGVASYATPAVAQSVTVAESVDDTTITVPVTSRPASMATSTGAVYLPMVDTTDDDHDSAATVGLDVVSHQAEVIAEGSSTSDGLLRYVVQPPAHGSHDCLWDIADRHLDDPLRWREIFALNQDPAHGVVIEDPDVVLPGWVLRMPADATGLTDAGAPQDGAAEGGAGFAAPQPPTAETGAAPLGPDATTDQADAETAPLVTVPQAATPGTFGPHAAAPESAEVAAPEAEVASQPESAANDAPTEVIETDHVPDAEQDAAEADTANVAVAAEPADEHITDAAADAADQAVDDDADAPETTDLTQLMDNTPQWLVTGCGVSCVMAGGLAALLAGLRMRQRNRRQPGQRIAMPNAIAADVERQLRALRTEVSAEATDLLLRRLAGALQAVNRPFPVVHGFHLTKTTANMFSAEVADPVTPWQVAPETPLQWTAAMPEADGALVHRESADRPYPALVMVGQDADGGALLLDLEAIGALSFTGPADICWAAQLAVMVELLTSPWSADCQLTVLSQQPVDVPVLTDDYRVTVTDAVDDCIAGLERHVDRVQLVLRQHGLTNLAQARAAGVSADVWAPRVLIVRQPLTAKQHNALRNLTEHYGSLGIAVVTGGIPSISDWTVSFDEAATIGEATDDRVPLSATFMPGSTVIWPQLVPDVLLDRVAELLLATTMPAEDGPEWARNISDAPLASGVTSDIARDVAAMDIALVGEPSTGPTDVPVADTTVLSLVTGQPDVYADSEAAESDKRAAVAAVTEDDQPDVGCVINVLGPITVTGATGPSPRSVGQDHQPVVAELLACIMLADDEVTTSSIAATLSGRSGPLSARTVHTRIAQARVWLSENADGELLVPHVAHGEPVTLAAEVRSDWELFTELVGEDASQTTVSDLLAALRLVRGRPCIDATSRTYSWAVGHAETMAQGIVDVAHECATRAAAVEDWEIAREAAATGRLVDPTSELMWTHALRIEAAAGEHHRLAQLHEEFKAVIQVHQLEPGPQLTAMLDRLSGKQLAPAGLV